MDSSIYSSRHEEKRNNAADAGWLRCACADGRGRGSPGGRRANATAAQRRASVKPIPSLSRADFSIFEDGAPREIQSFSPAETPYNILLLFDRSASTQGQWPFLLRAISRFITELPDQHRIALAAFDDKPEMIMNWQSAREFAKQAFRTIPTDNAGTDLYQAVEWAAGQFKGAAGRKGIILLTDGVDNRLSRKLVSFDRDRNPSIAPPQQDGDFQKMLRTVSQSGMLIYFVAVNTDKNLDPRLPKNSFDLLQRTAARQRMEIAAERSNGTLHLPRSIEDVGALYQKIGNELGNSYSVGFRPGKVAQDGAFHRIEVRVKDKDMRVTQSREGYYAR
jgi:Ca-activated chloride channel family protein